MSGFALTHCSKRGATRGDNRERRWTTGRRRMDNDQMSPGAMIRAGDCSVPEKTALKLALCQLNPTVGDVTGNSGRIVSAIDRARSAGADLAIVPEQAILGYPAKDLLLRESLIDANVTAMQRIAAEARGIAVIVGFAEPNEHPRGRGLYNSAALLADGRLVATSRKRLLPTYDVFDEVRYFEPAATQTPVEFAGRRIGLTICEDMWSGQQGLFARPIYSCDPLGDLAAAGCDLLINISASPWSMNKHARRVEMMAEHARRLKLPLVYVNQVGGNDDLLFDGASCVLGANGELLAQARAFAEDMLLIDLDRPEAARREPIPSGLAGVHDALVMGLRDYVHKCGFARVVIGVSGGVDSAVVAALAVAALGPENVRGVAMPSRHSSEHSLSDARALARNLDIHLDVIEIEPMHAAYESTLAPVFAGRGPDATEENLQARIRGATLMALSNKFGALLLTTGN
jgi:predicted amidohydrolase